MYPVISRKNRNWTTGRLHAFNFNLHASLFLVMIRDYKRNSSLIFLGSVKENQTSPQCLWFLCTVLLKSKQGSFYVCISQGQPAVSYPTPQIWSLHRRSLQKKQGGTNNLWIRTKEHYPECLEKYAYSAPHWGAFVIGQVHREFQFDWTSETLCHSASEHDTLQSALL